MHCGWNRSWASSPSAILYGTTKSLVQSYVALQDNPQPHWTGHIPMFIPVFPNPEFIYPKLLMDREHVLLFFAVSELHKGEVSDTVTKTCLKKKFKKIPLQTLRREFGTAGWSHAGSQFLPGFSPPVFPQLFLHNRVGKNWVADFVSVKLHYWKQLIGSVA